MPKLVITIEEQYQQIEGKTLMGYAVLTDTDFEYPEDSMIPFMAPLITKAILMVISHIHTTNGAVLHKEGMENISLESLMAEQAAKLESPFPSNIET